MSNGMWERLHYDWSDPQPRRHGHQRFQSVGGPSRHTYTFTRRPDGATDLDAVVVRDGENFRGGCANSCSGYFVPHVLGKELEKTVKAIEARALTSAVSLR